MITLRPVPLFGSGIGAKSSTVTCQRRLNVYYEQRQDGDKSKVVIYGTPGLVPSLSLSQAPTRGMIGTQSYLFAVGGGTFSQITSAGGLVATGQMSSSTGNVAMATNNTTQVLVADGLTGSLWDLNAHTLTPLPSSYPAAAQSITYVSGFFVAEQPGSQKFWVSNFNDGSTWNSLAFASASAYPDLIVAVDNLGGNLITLSQLHYEVWQNSGFTPQPFAPVVSAVGEYGLAAVFSRAHVQDNLIFLAQTRQGQITFVRLQGYNAIPISNPDLDYIINRFPTYSDAIALSYGIDRHQFYQVTFPTANRSFLFDMESQLWSEVQTGASVLPVRHQANFGAYVGGKTIVSDFNESRLYTLDPNYYLDDDQPIVREIITRHVSAGFNRLRPSSLYLDFETGVGLQNGQGANPQVMLKYSKDNGHTWSAERWRPIGRVGQYRARVNWRRFGSSYDATFWLRMTDPVKFVITEGAMKVRVKSGAQRMAA